MLNATLCMDHKREERSIHFTIRTLFKYHCPKLGNHCVHECSEKSKSNKERVPLWFPEFVYPRGNTMQKIPSYYTIRVELCMETGYPFQRQNQDNVFLKLYGHSKPCESSAKTFFLFTWATEIRIIKFIIEYKRK